MAQSRGAGRKTRRRSLGAGHGSRGGVYSPSDGSTSGCVRVQEWQEGREGREEVPAHVTQTGTVFSPGESGEVAKSPEETEENWLLQLLILLEGADSHSFASFGGSENSPRKGASLLARDPRAEASHESYLRELRPSGGACLRLGGALFRALVQERTLLNVGYALVRGIGIS
jgi:hypothetical protein